MTAEIHSLQAKIEGLGREACTRFLQPGTVPKAIELSITSRFIGLVLAVYDTLRSTWLSPLRLSRAVFVPLKHDGCTLRGLRRATSGLARTVATAAFRIFCSMAGVIAPEVVFNRLRLHEKLLRLGVYNRVQNVYLSVIPGAGVYGLEDRIIRRPSSDVIPSLQPQLSASVEDRVRQRVFEDVMGRVEEQQQRHMDGPLGWKLPLGRMLRESVLRALRLEFGVADPQPNPPPQAPPALVHQPHPAAVDDMYEDPFIQVFVDMDGVADPQPNPPPQALPILGHQPHRAAVNDVYEALLAQVIANANGGEWQVLPPDGDLFWETVPHSVPQWLQIFQGCLLDAIQKEARAVYGVGLYTSEEVRDMQTAFIPIINRAILRVINEHVYKTRDGFVFCREGAAIRSNNDIVRRLIPMKEIIDSMTGDERSLLPYYLIADLDRCRRVKPNLPDLDSLPKVKECFQKIGHLVTDFVLHNMPDATRAFALPDVP